MRGLRAKHPNGGDFTLTCAPCGEATLRECQKRGISKGKTFFMPDPEDN
jgi:hypothetical protein